MDENPLPQRFTPMRRLLLLLLFLLLLAAVVGDAAFLVSPAVMEFVRVARYSSMAESACGGRMVRSRKWADMTAVITRCH